MDTGYAMVMEPGNLVWTMVGYVVHGVALGLQVALVAYLLGTGVAALRDPARRAFGFARAALGVALLLPAAVSAPWLVTLVACAGVLGLMLAVERGAASTRVAQWIGGAAIGAAAFVAAFSIWERDDPLTLGGRVLFKMQEWRTHEIAWQLENDRSSPKVGQLAPDFELADPTGTRTARLSSKRGRPVALVFGSYT